MISMPELDAALHDALDDLAEPIGPADVDSAAARMGVRATIGSLPLDAIYPRSDQPRQSMDAQSLEELTASIRSNGVLQPIRVRSDGDGWQIIAGERRWTAARAAGLTEIPAVVVAADDDTAYIEALIENIQREDLNQVDRAQALKRLRVNLGLQSWTQVGQTVGITRQHVYNLLNLMNLPPAIQEDIRVGDLTEKHGRALLSLRGYPQQQDTLWRLIGEREMSGADAIGAAKAMRPEPPSAKVPAPVTQSGAFRHRVSGETTVSTLGGAQVFLADLAVVQLASGGSKTTGAGLWLSALRSDLVEFRRVCTEANDINGWRLALDMVREVMAGGPIKTRGM